MLPDTVQIIGRFYRSTEGTPIKKRIIFYKDTSDENYNLKNKEKNENIEMLNDEDIDAFRYNELIN